MLTRWGRELDADHPLPEHPRPQLVRDTPWVNLNGRWRYAIKPATNGARPPSTWDGEIVVPFSPEAVLSGVGRQLRPDEHLWYQRDAVVAPAGDRVLLHCGAVDQTCTVWVNGTEVGTHTGGYLPFSFDITGALVPGTQRIELRVTDLSETGVHARGKQRLERGRIWYTAQSGIWQTIWLEAVPAVHIVDLAVVPDLDAGAFAVTLTTSDGERRTETVRPADPRRWTPEDPVLHPFTITHGQDVVHSSAALRTVGTGTDAHGVPCFLLNGEPYPHVGVLDQGYWPDGLMTAPSDAALVHDITAMKELGFTVLRKHAKIEPLRWYHHCDRLGMLVWQDMVNGGGRYRELVTNLPARRPVRISDHRYGVFFRDDAAGRAEFEDEVRRTVTLLRSTACVAVWVPFNEGWGQFDANRITAKVGALDPTRPVSGVSGWIDQGGGAVRSHHRYLRPFRMPRSRWPLPWPRRDRRVQALSEYGGYSLAVAGHHASTRQFGYRRFEDAETLAAAFEDLHHAWIVPAVRDGLGATVYTQLSDIEDELNGLLTADREVLKIAGERVRRVNEALREAFRSRAARPPSAGHNGPTPSRPR